MAQPARATAEGRGIYMVEGTGTPEPSPPPRRFIAVPLSVALRADLSHGALRLYLMLQHHDGERGCFPSYKLLAAEMGCSERAVKAYRAELEALGFVEHRRGGGSASNRYELRPDPPGPMCAKSAHMKSAKSALLPPKCAKSALVSVQKTTGKSANFAHELDPLTRPIELDVPPPTGVAPANGDVPKISRAHEPPLLAAKPEREQPSADAYECVQAWCLGAKKRLEGDERRRKALLMGDLLRQCPGGKDEALRYIEHDLGRRAARGKPPNVAYLVQDYHGGWEREGTGGRASEAGRGQSGVPGETGTAEGKERYKAGIGAHLEAQRRAAARAHPDVFPDVPAVSVSDP